MVFFRASTLILGFIFLNIAALIFTYTMSHFNLKKAAKLLNKTLQQEQRQIAISLRFYPIVYMILTLPLAVARTANKGSLWYFVGESLYACEGWCNVLLYTTREGVIRWTWTGWRKELLDLMDAYQPTPRKTD